MTVSGSGRNPVDKLFLVHPGLKITLPAIALLQKNSDIHAVKTRVGRATYRYGISQKRIGGMVSTQADQGGVCLAYRAIPTHFQP